MWWIYALAISVVMSPRVWAASLGATTRAPYYYSPYYNSYDSPRSRPASPFSVPGKIIEGITTTDVVEASGDLWTADTVIEGASQVCDRLGPAISAFLVSVSADTTLLGSVCGLFRSENVEEECGKLWDEIFAIARRPDLADSSQSILPDFRCREGYLSYDYFGYDFGDWNVTYEAFTPVPDEAEPVEIDPNQFNPYDPCSEKGIERVNNIVFELVDWLGPSLLDAFYGRGGEPYAVCGLMRYFFSMNVQEAIQRFIGVLKFPLADILEILQPQDICTLINELVSHVSEEEAAAALVVKDLLEQFSGLSAEEFCDFMAEEQTREAYLEQAETIISNILLLIHDEPRCNSILETIAPHDQMEYFYKVTGFHVSIESERSEFCSILVAAFDPSSTYVPTPFELPPGVYLGYVRGFFQIPGEAIPGLTSAELLRIVGAGYRAELIIDAVTVLCDAFENFLTSSVIEEDRFDVRGFCLGARHRALGVMEEYCLAKTVPSHYREDHPVGLRSFNPTTVNIYIYHVMTEADDISKEEICPAVDRILTEASLPELDNVWTDLFLTEALPAVHGLCQNWEAAFCYWKPYCPVPEPPTTEAPVEGVTEYPWYNFHPYVPDPEYVERANAEFDEITAGLENLAWLVTGFDSRAEACALVADAIDPLSGRGDRSAVVAVRDRINGLLYDVDRCSRVVDASLGLIRERDLQHILTGGNTNIVYQFTGYQTSLEFCQVVARAHAGGPLPPVTLPPGPKGVATYNVVANIVVHIQRVARAIV